MNLILCDYNLILCTEWEKNFRDEPKVQIVCGDFKSVPEYDCIVSPANSFGIMDGGFDLALINYFGHELMKHVQDKIGAEYAGEQMYLAYKSVVQPPERIDWQTAVNTEQKILNSLY